MELKIVLQSGWNWLKYIINKLKELIEPTSAEGEKIKICQFNFELTFNGLICKGNGLSQCPL